MCATALYLLPRCVSNAASICWDAMQAGMDGFMTGFAFPEALKAINDAYQAGRPAEAFAIYRHWLPLMVFEQQPVRCCHRSPVEVPRR